MNVLWIAPDVSGMPDLPRLDEIGGLSEIPGAVIRSVCGNITRGRVAIELQKLVDVVAWSGHGKRGRLFLTNGRTVGAGWVAAQSHLAAPKLFILAACGSGDPDQHLESLAHELSYQGVNAVGFPFKTSNDGASTYIVEVVRAMAAGATVGAAHKVALAETAEVDKELADHIILIPALTNGYRDVVDQMKGFDTRLGSVERKIDVVMHVLSDHTPTDGDGIKRGFIASEAPT